MPRDHVSRGLQRIVLLHVVVYARDFGFSRLWGRARFRAKRGFASRRGAFAACEAHHSIARERSEHLRARERASGARRGHHTARRAGVDGGRCASVGSRNYQRLNSINFAFFLIRTALVYTKYYVEVGSIGQPRKKTALIGINRRFLLTFYLLLAYASVILRKFTLGRTCAEKKRGLSVTETSERSVRMKFWK